MEHKSVAVKCPDPLRFGGVWLARLPRPKAPLVRLVLGRVFASHRKLLHARSVYSCPVDRKQRGVHLNPINPLDPPDVSLDQHIDVSLVQQSTVTKTKYEPNAKIS